MSEGDETVHHHQEVDKGLAGLLDDPDEIHGDISDLGQDSLT